MLNTEANGSGEKMYQMFRREKNTILLFAFGFFIGIFLEIVVVENGKLVQLILDAPQQARARTSPPRHLEQNIQVTCLILLKHKHLRYITTAKKTWLDHCDDYHIVDVQKPGKVRKVPRQTTTEIVRNLVQDYKTCTKKDVKEIVGQSAWSGLCQALHITKPKDWLIIVPDSVLVLVENLRLFVKDMNSDDGHYFGYALKHHEADYNALSAGVLLSRGSVTRLVERFDVDGCDSSGKYWRNEDFYLGKYLKEMGILPKDTRDEEGRGRFHGYNLNHVLWPGKLVSQSDYKRKALYPVLEGFRCCSRFLITLDVSDPDAIYNLYFFLYRLTATHKHLPPSAPPKSSAGFFWKDFLREEGYNETGIEEMSSEEYFRIWEKKLPVEMMYEEMRKAMKDRKEDT